MRAKAAKSEPRAPETDLFGGKREAAIRLHHNAQRVRCDCGRVLELEPKTQRVAGRLRIWDCACGTRYEKPKVNFRGEG